MTNKTIPCRKCGLPADADEDAEAVVCARCAVGIENYLDAHVLTPENCLSMRVERDQSALRLARLTGCTRKQIKSFEAGRRNCPAELVKPLYEWYFGG